MLCPNCHGTRYVTDRGRRLPCPECGGVGEVHCCDGLREQIDPTADADAAYDDPD